MQFFALLNGRPTLFQGLFLKGSPLSPSFAFADDPITGFFLYGTSQLGVAVSGDWSVIFAPGGVIYGRQGNNRISLNSAGGIELVAAGTDQDIKLTPTGLGRVLIEKTAAYLEVNSDNLRRGRFGADGSNAVSVGTITNSPLDFFVFNTSAARFATTSLSFLLGKQTDSSNGRLQLADHTTAAGGIGIGTDLNLFRFNSSTLKFSCANPYPQISVTHSGSNTELILRANTGSGNGEIQTASTNGLTLGVNGSTALVIDVLLSATFSGKIVSSASTTTRAGLQLPHGAAPTAPVNGDIWTTTAGLYVRINGATVGPLT